MNRVNSRSCLANSTYIKVKKPHTLRIKDREELLAIMHGEYKNIYLYIGKLSIF